MKGISGQRGSTFLPCALCKGEAPLPSGEPGRKDAPSPRKFLVPSCTILYAKLYSWEKESSRRGGFPRWSFARQGGYSSCPRAFVGERAANGVKDAGTF